MYQVGRQFKRNRKVPCRFPTRLLGVNTLILDIPCETQNTNFSKIRRCVTCTTSWISFCPVQQDCWHLHWSDPSASEIHKCFRITLRKPPNEFGGLPQGEFLYSVAHTKTDPLVAPVYCYCCCHFKHSDNPNIGHGSPSKQSILDSYSYRPYSRSECLVALRFLASGLAD